MPRISLSHVRGTVLAPDVAERLRLLEVRTQDTWKGKVRIRYSGVPDALATWAGVVSDPGPTGISVPQLSMRPTGREVYLKAVVNNAEDFGARATGVEALWSIAIPLGFVPWNRHPVPGPCDDVFHVPGVWANLMEAHWAFGEGERAWASLCCASQLDVGRWGGDRWPERTVQAHLHRIGQPCGPVDGVITDRVHAALRRTPLAMATIAQAAQSIEALPDINVPRNTAPNRRLGALDLPGDDVTVTGHGGVRVARTPRGYSIDVEGAGRAIIDVAGYSSVRK